MATQPTIRSVLLQLMSPVVNVYPEGDPMRETFDKLRAGKRARISDESLRSMAATNVEIPPSATGWWFIEPDGDTITEAPV